MQVVASDLVIGLLAGWSPTSVAFTSRSITMRMRVAAVTATAFALVERKEVIKMNSYAASGLLRRVAASIAFGKKAAPSGCL